MVLHLIHVISIEHVFSFQQSVLHLQIFISHISHVQILLTNFFNKANVSGTPGITSGPFHKTPEKYN